MHSERVKVASYLAKAKFPELLRGVRAGNEYEITSRGVVVANLVSAEKVQHQEKEDVIEQIKAFMKKKLGKRVNIKALIEEGRA